jgi:radical SAM superfamily enzyme YgiQ (UPF0313 family)
MADIILLTGSSYVENETPRIVRHLGAYRIASELRKHGYDAVVIDYTQYMTAQEIINAISKVLTKETLWLGYSSTFFYLRREEGPIPNLVKMYQSTPYEKITTIYDYVKTNSNTKIVFGGAYALLAHADHRVDYYIAGYGDVSIVDLTNFLAGKKNSLDHFTEKTIEGKTCIVIDSGKYPEPKMDQLQTFFHEEHLLPNEAVPVEFARGCIFKCKFCSYPLLGKKKGTYIRDMEEVRDELVKLWETKGTDSYYITDDTFNDDNDKMEQFHKLFTSLPFKPKFTAFLRLDLIDRFPHQADLLLDAGLVGNFFGIESFNWKSAKAIGKGLHPDRVKERLIWVREKWHGKVNTGIGLIIGLPYDDEKYFQELWEYVHSKDYPVQHTSFNALHITDKTKGVNLYGSEFAMNPEIYGYNFNDQGWYHEEQGLTFNKCREIAENFYESMYDKVLVPDFSVLTYMNMGIPLEHITKYPEVQLKQMYNISKMNDDKLFDYKQMIGAI